MNYLPPPTTDVDNPTPTLRALGSIARGYSRLFAEGKRSDWLSPPKPVRRTGFDLNLTVADSTETADGVRAITLISPDSRPLPSWNPGAHIDVFTPHGRQRHYSLTGDPADRSSYRIAVRLVPDGAGSAEMHALRAGDTLRIRGPRNAFPYASNRQVRFVAAGIGITPLLPMVRAAHAAGSDWHLLYTGRSIQTMPFVDELRALDPRRVTVLTDADHGVPTVRDLLGSDEDEPVYLCGPGPMIDAAGAIVADEQPAREFHSERFSALPPVDGRPFRIDFASGGSVDVAGDETALAAITRVKPDVRYSCQQGFCGACRVKVVCGDVEHHDRVLIGEERNDSMMICVSRAAADSVVIDL